MRSARKFRCLIPKLPARTADTAIRLCVLLRLACLLNRSRSQRTLPELELAASKKKLALSFPAGWLADHPLTGADLEQERTFLKAAGIKLKVGELKGDGSAG